MLEGRWLLYMFKWIFQTKAEHKARPSFWIDNFHRTGRWYCRVEWMTILLSIQPVVYEWDSYTAVHWKYKFQNRPVWMQAVLYENMRPTQPFCVDLNMKILTVRIKAKGAVCVILTKVGWIEGIAKKITCFFARYICASLLFVVKIYKKNVIKKPI